MHERDAERVDVRRVRRVPGSLLNRFNPYLLEE
jgi:hypothetical protein